MRRTLITEPISDANALNPNDQLRQESEQELYQFRQTNANDYFEIIGQNISNQELDSNLKIAHFNIMAKSLGEYFQEKSYWDWMSEDMRIKIKNLGLQFLTDANNNVLRAAANFVARIFMLELSIPNQKWSQLLVNLASNVLSDNFNIKKASI